MQKQELKNRSLKDRFIYEDDLCVFGTSISTWKEVYGKMGKGKKILTSSFMYRKTKYQYLAFALFLQPLSRGFRIEQDHSLSDRQNLLQ